METLKIKETDRVAALHQELKKVEVNFWETTPTGSNQVTCSVQGQAKLNQPIFATYEDHRMAMAFAPLAMYGTIEVEEPMVVVKSYPDYWKDLTHLGFVVQQL